ncbi:MAG: hypothetical protein U5L95_04640 [Candidatus Saccharibacteria bacterium]|nr:hypothetical protein [Candidatus Saccharibacteria bacterium]
MTRSIEVDYSPEGDFTVDENGDVQPMIEETQGPHPVRPEDMPHDQFAVGLRGRLAVKAFTEAHRSTEPTTVDVRSATPAHFKNRKDILG